MSKTWTFEAAGGPGAIDFYGVDIFGYDWKDTGEKAQVKDPNYNQDYSFNVYTAEICGVEVRFAAGEFSPYVWGFFMER